MPNLFDVVRKYNELEEKIQTYEQEILELKEHIDSLTAFDNNDFIRQEPDYRDVNRFEVIDDTGRAYTKRLFSSMEFSRQDNGKTLKIFLNNS